VSEPKPKPISAQTAEKLAKFAFGPSAQVKRHSDPKNRNRRYAIYFSASAEHAGGPKDHFAVYLAGAGDSWESAMRAANDNPFAKEKAEHIKGLRNEFQLRSAELDQQQYAEVMKKVVKPNTKKKGKKK
jgi:hypothetical protein